ncbi:MAG: MerC domain-containing protein [Flavipsychrobacter sp.]|nr:MerC domain-containing protein [Flavipsychrobacter sp.]
MRLQVHKISTIALFLTAMATPCCFPLFGFVLAALGLGSFELFGGWTMWVFLGLVLISLLGLSFSYRKHRCTWPLLVAVPSAILIYYSYLFIDAEYWTTLIYIGMFGLLVASGIDYYRMRLHNKNAIIELQSIITCPICGHKKEETMPVDACQYFYECESCHSRLKPKEGDCCVFCSYGTVKCPPIQSGEKCC